MITTIAFDNTSTTLHNYHLFFMGKKEKKESAWLWGKESRVDSAFCFWATRPSQTYPVTSSQNPGMLKCK